MSEKIVMIHGMWGGAWCRDNFKHFFEEKGYQCFTPILRHHNVDPKDKPNPSLGRTSLLDYAQDLEEYIHKLDDKPIIIGHSMGGLLAQTLGSRELSKAIVLLTPASPSGINALKYSVIKSFWSILSKWGFWRNPHIIPFNSAVYSMMHLLSDSEKKVYYDRLVYESGRAAKEIGFWLFDLKGATKVDESKVTCPVLVISGTEDRITPSSVVRKVAKKYKNVSTYEEFENHAHLVIVEPGWEDIAEFVSDWLNQVLG